MAINGPSWQCWQRPVRGMVYVNVRGPKATDHTVGKGWTLVTDTSRRKGWRGRGWGQHSLIIWLGLSDVHDFSRDLSNKFQENW